MPKAGPKSNLLSKIRSIYKELEIIIYFRKRTNLKFSLKISRSQIFYIERGYYMHPLYVPIHPILLDLPNEPWWSIECTDCN